jgi:predicted N-acetyltransferase YhbS
VRRAIKKLKNQPIRNHMESNQKSYLNLLEESFPGIKDNILRCESLDFTWEASKLFNKEENGEALSHVALLECPVLIEGRWHNMGALHGICTKSTHRGQGLATELIQEALQWAKGRCDAVFLFTEIPGFYEKLSFQRIQEYRFHLSYSHPKGTKLLRPLAAPQDNDLFLRCFHEHEPVSKHLWVKDNGLIASFNALFATYPSYWSVHYSPTIDGLISYSLEDKTLHLFDVVASKIPSLNAILDHMPSEINDIYFYFSPDRFTAEATPEPYLYDKCHLLIHGEWPITRPFMISPLSRC